MKTCSKCGATKPLCEFVKDRRRKDGRRGYCLTCLSTQTNVRREAVRAAGQKLVPRDPLRTDSRFMSHVRVTANGCWEWVGHLDKNGYGCFSVNGVPVFAHHYAHARWQGPIPEGLVIDHLCRNPKCVNPEHLEAVTHRTNSARSTNPNFTLNALNQCHQGHSLTDPANVIQRKNGTRECRTCTQARYRKNYHLRKSK